MNRNHSAGVAESADDPLSPASPGTSNNSDGLGLYCSAQRAADAARVGLATHPYILQFGSDDVHGRLRQGDMILMSQTPNIDAENHVVRYRKKHFLARPNEDGSWSRLAEGQDYQAIALLSGTASESSGRRLFDQAKSGSHLRTGYTIVYPLTGLNSQASVPRGSAAQHNESIRRE